MGHWVFHIQRQNASEWELLGKTAVVQVFDLGAPVMGLSPVLDGLGSAHLFVSDLRREAGSTTVNASMGDHQGSSGFLCRDSQWRTTLVPL